MPIGGISVLVLIVILAFAIDRVTRAILFLLSLAGWWARLVPDPRLLQDRVQVVAAERRQTLAYAVLLGVLAVLAVVTNDDVRILAALMGRAEEDRPSAILDMVVTMIVLVGGSDLLSRVLQVAGTGGGGGAAGTGAAQPVEVTGRITLESDRGAEGSRRPDGT